MHKIFLPLLVSHAASFLAIVISYVACSRLLTPGEFGAYTAALAIGAFSTMVLDGGIRTGIIKHPVDLTRDQLGGLLLTQILVSVVLLGIVAIVYSRYDGEMSEVTWGVELVASFAALYLASYPWIGVSTAILERKLEYKGVARIEAISIVTERILPLVLLVLFDIGLVSFVVGLLVGRVFRLTMLVRLAPAFPLPRGWSTTRRLFKEGFWTQLGLLAATIRDNLHVLLVGPLFGAAWVGYYGWAMQLSAMASQVFVQVSARVMLPLAAQATTSLKRWQLCLNQTKLLSSATAPLLAGVVLIAPWVNHAVFQGKWAAALPLLVLFVARMLPGIATTPLAPLLLVERGTRCYAEAQMRWMGYELVVGIVALLLFGAVGLGYSCAVMAWLGVAIMAAKLGFVGSGAFQEIVRSVLLSPAVLVSVVGACVFAILLGWPDVSQVPYLSMGGALVIGVLCVFLDPLLRKLLLSGNLGTGEA
jgi:O-antigen/teichoic acid export membrane protein